MRWGLFLDISGAFDSMWWPSVLYQLTRRGITKEEYKLMKSYFKDRLVKFAHGQECTEKVLSKGCLQGSVLGPLLWTVEFDSLLRVRLPTACKLIAYADDALVLVEGDSKNDLVKIIKCGKCSCSMGEAT